jgi:hypothetical protein
LVYRINNECFRSICEATDVADAKTMCLLEGSNLPFINFRKKTIFMPSYVQEGGRSSSPSRGKISLLCTSSRPVLVPTQPSVQWVLQVVSPGVKRQRHEVDSSFPSNAEVQNGGVIPSLHHTSSWRGS